MSYAAHAAPSVRAASSPPEQSREHSEPGAAVPPRTMLAVVKQGPGPEAVVLRELPVPVPAAGQVLVKVAATGICGTDVHIAHDEYAAEPPVVMGHEVTGTVVAAGGDEEAHWLGLRVALETYFSACEACAPCRSGRRNLCAKRRSIGSFEDGGFASHLVVPARNLHALPDWLDEVEGALAEPLACVAHCLMSPAIVQAGDRVLVTGPGTMGQLAAQVALAHGAEVTLLGLPRDAERLAIAASLGIATATELPAAGEYDVVLEASGSEGGARLALGAARRGGRYVQIGIFGRPVALDLDQVLTKELVITSGFASTAASWADAMRLLERRLVRLAPLVTARVPLPEFDDAFGAAQRGEGIKTLIVPGLIPQNGQSAR